MFQTLKKNAKKIASSLTAGVLLFSQLAAPVAIFADNLGGYNAQLTGPISPTSSNTYTWEVTGSKSDQGQEISHIDLTGCWTKSNILSFNASKGAKEIKNDGTLKVDNIQDGDLPLTVSVVFKTSYLSTGSANTFIKTGGGNNTGFNYQTAGPNCQSEPEEFGSISVSKKVDADGNGVYEGGNGTANTLGFRWGVDSETPNRLMGEGAANVTPGQHSVTEKLISGYVFTGWYYTEDYGKSCANPQGTTLPIEVNVENKQTKKITLCNQSSKGTVKLIKKVINNNGGTATANDFGLTIGGTSVTSGQALTLNTGSYTINEAGLSGYAFVSITGTGCPTELGGTVTLAKGQSITCTITNDDMAAQMQVIKNVTNNNGGTAVAGDFTLKVNDQAKTQNQYFAVNPGVHTVTENGPSGYSQTGLSCVNDTTQQALAHPVNIGLGQSVTCTVTNDDNAASLTVIKNVINDNGGTKTETDFTMGVNGTNVSDSSFPGNKNGTTVTLNVGNFLVKETGPSGYAATFSTDCTGIIALGEHKTCTITNDDIAPLLKVIKYVSNSNGGLLGVSDFMLYVDGNRVISGVPNIFYAGSHAVSEANQPGYTASNWGGDCDANGNILLNIGDSATCTITNYDQPTEITVTKEVVNDNGGTAVAGDFTLKVNDDVVQSGVTNNFDSNASYTISETDGPNGYEQTSLTCYDTTSSTPVETTNPFTTEPGHTYDCTIINDDIAPTLKIKKIANPEDGQDFHFTSEQLGGFTLDDDDDATLDNKKQFSGLAAGSYTIVEQATDNWNLDDLYCWGTDNYSVNWEANSVTVTLGTGDDVTCKFVNEKESEVNGYKFEDKNGNGEWDDGEPTLEGWTITLTKECDTENEQEARTTEQDECDDVTLTTVTDEDGFYSFGGLEEGIYTLCEVEQNGWIQTYPGTDDGCYQIVIDCPAKVICKDFGNFKLGKVTGVKFSDVNGNGQRDNGEPTLKNWVITLTKECSADIESLVHIADCEDEVQTTTTDETGAYSFSNLKLGDYKVCETQQTNWTQTFPTTQNGCHEFTITTSSQIVAGDFGNKFKPQVLGEAIVAPPTPPTLAVTGASTTKSMLVGLTVLSVLGALHFLTGRRKEYAK